MDIKKILMNTFIDEWQTLGGTENNMLETVVNNGLAYQVQLSYTELFSKIENIFDFELISKDINADLNKSTTSTERSKLERNHAIALTHLAKIYSQKLFKSSLAGNLISDITLEKAKEELIIMGLCRSYPCENNNINKGEGHVIA
jgi:hypothetical protein